jgi:putative acetyltransferase
MPLAIAIDDPLADDVRRLLGTHLVFSNRSSPPEHVHALDLDGLLDASVTLYGARDGGVLVGFGALKQLDATHGELKSMHVATAARGRGIGRAIVDHLLAVAAERGYRRVSLETGTMDDYASARLLYAKVGFAPCAPFAQYTDNAYSMCMTLELAPGLTAGDGDER